MTTASQIESVTTTLVDLPLVRPHRFAAGSIDHQSAVLVRLRTSFGVEGIGEAVVPGGPWWSGDCIEGIKILIDSYLAPLLIGQDAARVEQVVRLLDSTIPGAQFAKAGVEMAMWDARGKALGVPLHELLGGLFRDSVPVTWALGAEPAGAVIEEIQEKLDTGAHRSFKLKMGASEPAEDVARIRAVADALAAATSLRVDLNGTWDELTAMRWLPVLQDAGIEIVEQPVPGWNVEALSRIAACLTAPVMADESLRTPQDAVRLAGARAADVFAVKIGKSGGLSASSRIVAIAEASAIPCHGGTTIETSVGAAACAHLFCAAPGFTAGSEAFGPLLLAEDIVEEPVEYVRGHLCPPAGPGLGVCLDEAKLARFTRR
ncbi:MAG TPA: muconate cycloisomerase family protein [Pseudonocardiaceae bacterium]